MGATSPGARILSIDIGGSTIKATILSEEGELIQEYKKVKTPKPATPDAVLKAISTLIENFQAYDKVSVGFPGYIKNGVTCTAPNLGTDLWRGFDLASRLGNHLQKPIRVANDADLHGLGVVRGAGLELVITLGTGFGTAILMDGALLPHLELAHHPISKKRTYDGFIGDKAYIQIGRKRWNRRMKQVLKVLKVVFNYDRLYIGGGNADELDFKLDDNIEIITNKDGIKGGARLWQLHREDALRVENVRS
ncbi:polyphosphate glucokinase [Arcticibacter pallidicorallinus]|uniref:Polyphosphate glucokinase n=1 Tax=Arcticibacter pallidicorallinus TaxID=1259464 RepID=A0A2T0U559_9SPHI|nr:ROK family protein [Arcticibacter pallidicorallinus]PRY53065.1 polyphosphate glucokinase [Arcticibacter pallidicorallinus]